jgi:hypothetical protein
MERVYVPDAYIIGFESGAGIPLSTGRAHDIDSGRGSATERFAAGPVGGQVLSQADLSGSMNIQ